MPAITLKEIAIRLSKLESRFDSFSGNVKETTKHGLNRDELQLMALKSKDTEIVNLSNECHNLREQLEALQEYFSKMEENVISANQAGQIQQLAECIHDIFCNPEIPIEYKEGNAYL